jgi:transposase-like protein
VEGVLQKEHQSCYTVEVQTIYTEGIEDMDAQKQFCPNMACKSRGEIGQGNIVVHGIKRPRYKCKTCGKTFSGRAGTAIEGIRKSTELFGIVISLLSNRAHLWIRRENH